MPKQSTLLYYSTSTHLAHYINTEYYYKKHFLWCSPIFDPESLGRLEPNRRIPVSSSPCKIYQRYAEDTAGGGDHHSALIDQNKRGILTGAAIQLAKKVINKVEYNRIKATVNKATIADFKPLLYIIPVTPDIKRRIKMVSVEKTANPLGVEYQIEDLQEGEYHIIEFIK